MTNEVTIDKLIEMRFTAMADAFRIQENDPSVKKLSFDERFGLLVDTEYTSRKNNRLKRLIKGACFDQPEAHVAAIDYHSGRKLNKDLILRLAKCDYIAEYRNIFITGATGSGKTYMACAFGMEACKHFFKTKYVRLPDLLIDLDMARQNGTYHKVLNKYANPTLLIIDEWLLLKASESEQRDILSCFSAAGKNPRPSSAPSSHKMAGMNSWVVITALWLMQSLTVLFMTPISLTL